MCKGPQTSRCEVLFQMGKTKYNKNPASMNETKQIQIKTCWLMRQALIRRALNLLVHLNPYTHLRYILTSPLYRWGNWGGEVKCLVQGDTADKWQSRFEPWQPGSRIIALNNCTVLPNMITCILKSSLKLQCEKQIRGQLERTGRDQLKGYYSLLRKVAWNRVIPGKMKRSRWFTVI